MSFVCEFALLLGRLLTAKNAKGAKKIAALTARERFLPDRIEGTMIRFTTSVPIFFALALCLSQAQAQNDHSLAISGTQTWTDTGVDVALGDELTFTAGTKTGSAANCNPDGSGDTAGDQGHIPLRSSPAGALIAKITENATPVMLGAKANFKASQSGRLFLGLNVEGPVKCNFTVQLKVGGGGAAAADSGVRDKLSSAAQIFFKGQFGGKESAAKSDSNNAVSENAAPANTGASPSAGGLKLPSVILDAGLRKNIDGLPRRIHDHLGNLGDMVNFVIVGSLEKAQAALDAADWHVADVDSKEAGLKAIMNTYQKKDYLQMPMSHLYLFDRVQDFGYEQAQAFSVVATRHHFRIWKAPFTWNNETVWVGAATHDTGFEKDVRTGKLTHKIDPNVDDERENLASGLQKSGKTKSMTYYLPPGPVQEAKNASGGSYHSDGRLLVVFLQ